MARKIEINKVTEFGTDKKGNAVFRAAGTLNGEKFVALTIQWKGEPIFKLQEGGSHRKMAESRFTRGDRIAAARACKAARLEIFGNGSKEQVAPELEAGETVELAAK
tara:strand:+ start:2092 stop:2412 length:321 start_codon:yes stop_codon:yes gene_type:complete